MGKLVLSSAVLWSFAVPGCRSDRRPTALAAETELRPALRTGSSISSAEQYLAAHIIEHSFDPPTQTVHAIVRSLKGSNGLVEPSLTCRLHFDNQGRLDEFRSEVVYTGP